MDELSAIFAEIKKYNRIIIHRHQRPDPDAIGSQVGLARILRASFPYKQVWVVGKQIPGFNWIGTMDEISGSDYHDALVIVTDTANAPRIDDRRFDNGAALVKIDHHPNDEPYGDLMWIDDRASSCSEMIASFYQRFSGELTMTPEAASALYAGIVGDTGRFLYPATTPKTMLVAGSLMAAGADASAIAQHENEITLPVARLSAYVYDHLTITESGAAFVTLTAPTLKKFGLTEAGTSAVVSLPGRLRQVVAWAIFVQQDDGAFRVRLRSKGPVINELAKHHHGGGHPLASGARAHDQAELDQVVTELNRLAADYQKEI